MEPVVRNELLDLVDPVQDEALRANYATGRVFRQAGKGHCGLCRLPQSHFVAQQTARSDSGETVLEQPADAFQLVATAESRHGSIRSQRDQGLEGKREGIELYGTPECHSNDGETL